MKILLLNPPAANDLKYIREGRCMQLTSSWAAIWPPLTLAILAQMAENTGDTARIFDANVEPLKLEGIPDILSDYDLLVLNTSFPSIKSDFEAARIAKKHRPGLIIVSFGVFFTMLGEESFPADGCIDYAISGEPEETFAELLAAIKEKRDIASVKGILYRDAAGKVVKTAPRPLIANIDTLPFPDRKLLKNELYVLPNNNEPFTLINTSRGCPYPCTFCIVKTYYGVSARRHSTKYILDEMAQSVAAYGIRNFLLWEEAFTLNRETVHEFCNGLLERGLKVNWAVTTRADSVDPETLRLMKQTGCFLIGMGIESSSQKILDAARKNEKVEDIEKGIKMCVEAGIPVMGHFIFGLPGETPETAAETINFMKRSGVRYMQSYCAVPYPGTEFGELAKKNGWINTDDWSRYDFGGESIVDMPSMPAAETTKMRRKAFRSFYLRPSKIWQELKDLSNIKSLLQSISFLRWMK